MPNHVTNILKIENATTEQTQEVLDFLAGDDDRPLIDFQNILPRPASLDIVSGTATPQDKASENVRVHGYPTWYEWCIAKWGTKWNAYTQVKLSPNEVSFETAWSTPIPIFLAIAARFPSIEFSVRYADEDIGSNLGTLYFKDGCLSSRTEPPGDWQTKERRMFAYSVIGISEEEINERESELTSR